MNQESNEKAGEDPKESSTEDNESSTEDTDAESSGESVEATAAETAEESDEELIGGSAEESEDESEDDSIEGSVEESDAESIEGSADESVEDSTGESAEEPAGALAGEASEDTSEQVPDGGDGGEGLPVVHGSVKWFNAEKGFGFIVADDGSGDIFLHLSALRNAGLETVLGGATIVCAVSRGPKGLQVDRVIEVDESTASPTSVEHRPRSPLGYDRPRHPPLTEVGEFVVATVKWFNPNKGFGFITVDETSPDIFVHMQTLRRCGVATLDSGQEVRVRIGQGAKGPQVAEIDVG